MPAVRLLLSLAMLLLLGGCHWIRWATPKRPAPAVAVEPLAPSPRLIVGRIVAVDPARQFAFIELAPDAPTTALAEGMEFTTRTPELRATGRLRASRYLRGRTLGSTIAEGQPHPGDEVVWLAP